jgi:hypothetical protein
MVAIAGPISRSSRVGATEPRPRLLPGGPSALAWWAMSTVATSPTAVEAGRSPADRRMRRLLRLPVDGPPARLMGAHGVVSRSIAVSAIRCLLTYVLVPVVGPLVGLWDTVGPGVGIALSLLSLLALGAGVRRFFAADHAWRWKYTAVATLVSLFVLFQLVFDIRALLG